jgi:AcrR family transcriptional regulator
MLMLASRQKGCAVPESTERRTVFSNASRGRRGDEGGFKRRGTGRTSRGRQTRQQLLDAARTIFERDGFLHARIADICDLAGIAHGSFYTYFASKEEIFTEIVDSVELELLTVDPAPIDTDPLERIRAANRHYLETYGAHAKIIKVINQVATIDARVLETRLQRQAAFARAIERRIRLLQDEGQADAGVDPAYAAQALGGMVAAFADFYFNTVNSFDPELDAVTEHLTHIWANAIGLRHTLESTAPTSS